MSTLSPSPKTPRSKMRTGLGVELRRVASRREPEHFTHMQYVHDETDPICCTEDEDEDYSLRKLKLRGGDRTDLKAEWLAFSNYKISMGQRSTLSAEKKGGGSLSHLDEKSDIEHHLSSELIGDMTSRIETLNFNAVSVITRDMPIRDPGQDLEERRRRSIEVSKRPVVTAGASGGQDGTADQQKSLRPGTWGRRSGKCNAPAGYRIGVASAGSEGRRYCREEGWVESRLGQELEFARKDDEPRGVRRKSYGAYPRAFDPVLTLAALRQQNRRDQVEIEERKRQEARGLRVGAIIVSAASYFSPTEISNWNS
ncbi:hypothetical protein B0H14DRAFT_2600636 [Mycena olivaceomarginata]|nr:hypothetical protein B0H14DRAFT_2600636 [Mycena olivaceomarginata]